MVTRDPLRGGMIGLIPQIYIYCKKMQESLAQWLEFVQIALHNAGGSISSSGVPHKGGQITCTLSNERPPA